MNEDALYALLVAAHEGLDEAESAALNARLVLLLAHRLGDEALVAELVEKAERR